MLHRRLTDATLTLIAVLSLAACEERKPVPPPEPSAQQAPLAACPPAQPQQAAPQVASLAALTAKAREAGAVRVIVRIAANVSPQALPAAQGAAVRTFTASGANEVRSSARVFPILSLK
jgi:hypothetical protein